ncbi:MAG: RHS repeat-associated core domain-containing protein [Oscillospiraceae bacterium]|nr:RHS repeat-associated core domain-containing protein [Oscillospiraceae bacterium]
MNLWGNRLRYRGYVYDTETDLYYCNSRYYNPEIGRWINADSVVAGIGENLLGYNMFTYCFNNPVNMTDNSGHWPQWIKDAVDWVNDKVIQPGVSFVKDIAEDINNFDSNNESEEKVLESNYFSSYKGVPVIRTNGDRSGSFGAIFLTRETNNRSNPEDVIRHEYGHTKQLEQLGIVNYALCIGLPSWQQWGTDEYYSKPWEITADVYGGVQSRNHSQSNIDRGFAYLEGSKIIGPLIWVFIE